MYRLPIALVFVALSLSEQAAHAQFTLRPNEEAVLAIPWPAAPTAKREGGSASLAPAQVPLSVGVVAQLLQTMVPPESAHSTIFAQCDASESNMGGDAVVAQNIYIANTGKGKCPPLGGTVRMPSTLLDVVR